MPKEIDFEEFEIEVGEVLADDQREWLARVLHDHVSGLITNMSMQVEIINKMIARDMDIVGEVASLKENVSAASRHIVAIEKTVRPKVEEPEEG